MESIRFLPLLILYFAAFWTGYAQNISSRPAAVKIGSIYTFNSTIGKVAKFAIEEAIKEVNADPSVLHGTELIVTVQNSNCSGFLGMVEALQFMETDVVAIIGPQCSTVATIISHVANELKVPLLSFATDPTLTSLQFPYFIRTTQSDMHQMTAAAEIVDYFGWKAVIAIYTDDDYGRNGIAALNDKMARKRCKISYRAGISPGEAANRSKVMDILVKVALMESRVIILHVSPDIGFMVFSVAQYLGMMDNGYAWIATDWLAFKLDSNSPLPNDIMDSIQGVLVLRQHTPDSDRKRAFLSKWKNITGGSFGMNTYGYYVYDSVWIVAHALDAFFNEGGKISFSDDPKLQAMGKGDLNLDAMSIFDGGELLRSKILGIDLVGLTGRLKFGSDRALLQASYDVINVIGTGYRRIGFWSNYSGLTKVPPETLSMGIQNHSNASQLLNNVIWPGETLSKPRGWVFPNNGKLLRIGVPRRVSYREFVSPVRGTTKFQGFCIDVFTAAVNLLPYAVPFEFVAFGDGKKNPSYMELVTKISTGVFDAAVGDIAIVTNRTKIVDFTQPYAASGLVIVAPFKKLNTGAWAFLRPFTYRMWIVTGSFFLVVGIVVWILEHRINDEFRGPPKKQVITILWFSFSTLFFAHRETTVSTLGRMVLIIWMFVVLIINSSYTASLTSILTVQQLSSPIKGLEELIKSDGPVGYQMGSFAEYYLNEELKVSKSRLIPLNSPEEYAEALNKGPKKGGVMAVVDERPYVELFLSSQCNFRIVGQSFTRSGWGFAFPQDSPLALDLSTAILQLAENGDLQRIHDKWLVKNSCTLDNAELESDRLHLKSFWGLFLICGVACGIALFIYFLQIIRRLRSIGPDQVGSLDGGSHSSHIQRIWSLMDEKKDPSQSSRMKRLKTDSSSLHKYRDEGSGRISTGRESDIMAASDSNIASNNKTVSARPAVVKIGAIFTFNSTVGRAAKFAIEEAVKDINSDPRILHGTQLTVTLQNSKCSGFLGLVEALRFMATDIVAIIGPQCSTAAHLISHVANELQVPLLSFVATDPTATSLQFPYLVRTTQSDLYQMAAVAEIVDYYGWKDVIGIFVDDDYGRNGMYALNDELVRRRCRISYKAGISPGSAVNRSDIMDLLIKVELTESRIIILHVGPHLGFMVFSVAHYLGMMGNGFVWIATDWLAYELDSISPLSGETMNSMQGVLVLRQHTADSVKKRAFLSRWKDSTGSFRGMNAHGLYAYDSVWLLAHATDAFFDQGGIISFSNDSRLLSMNGGNLHLDALTVFDDGDLLLNKILDSDVVGLTGRLKVGSDRSLTHIAYDILNVIGTGYRKIGYWSNSSGLSTVPPETPYTKLHNRSRASPKQYSVIWPGDTVSKPRGWVFPNNGKLLKIGVPKRVGFQEFISWVNETNTFQGFCIDVFTAAVSLLPYAVPYEFIPLEDGHKNPSYTKLVELVAMSHFDAAVGDITIVMNRTKMVDFTLPYAVSTLVVVAPYKRKNNGASSFLEPFTPHMWIVTGSFLVFVGIVMWILEHRFNDEFRGPPKNQVVTVLSYSFSAMFFAPRENTVSTLGRVVIIILLFVIMILNKSYTASLGSILTAQEFSSPIKGIESLIKGSGPIGYQTGSFVEYYLSDVLNISKSRLIPLTSPEEYAAALEKGPKRGGVVAVVDERPYINLFLPIHCSFKIIGQDLTKSGWGFAFPRDSQLAVDFSTRILNLAENGDLERIHDKWLRKNSCDIENDELESYQLHFTSFWVLFLVCGLACIVFLFIYFVRILKRFRTVGLRQSVSTHRSGSRSIRLRRLLSLMDEKEDQPKRGIKRMKMDNSSRQR